MLRCDSIGEPVSDRAIAAQAVTAGCRRAGGCAARRVLRLPADVSSDDCAMPRYWPTSMETVPNCRAYTDRPVPILRYHPLFPMVRQRRIRASFDSRCRLSTVKGLVVSRGPIPDCLFAKLEMTTPDLVGQPSFCS